MPKSGDPCLEAGTYVSTCPCSVRLQVAPGLEFTVCVSCGQNVEWRLAQLAPARPGEADEIVEAKKA